MAQLVGNREVGGVHQVRVRWTPAGDRWLDRCQFHKEVRSELVAQAVGRYAKRATADAGLADHVVETVERLLQCQSGDANMRGIPDDAGLGPCERRTLKVVPNGRISEASAFRAAFYPQERKVLLI